MNNLEKDVEKILISEKEIQKKILEIAKKISQDHEGKDLLMVCVLKGSMFFTADLIRHISIPLTLDFIAISSYGDATRSSGVVRILKDLEEDVENRHVIVVEDIVDTGLTADYVIKTLSLRSPAGIQLCCLLDKIPERKIKLKIDYKGFEIGDHFVVGYGLDFKNRYRHLPFVCTLKEKVTRG